MMIVSEQTNNIQDDFGHRIESIKGKSDCREIFRRFWPNCYREHGNVRCPWHEDKKPSAQLDKELFHCHACGLSYDAIDLYRLGANVEMSEALELIEGESGTSSPPTTTRKRQPNPKHKPSNEFIKTWNKLCKNIFSSEATAYIEETRQIKGLLPDLIQKELIAYHPKFKAYNHETESSDTWRAIAFPLVNASKTEMLGIQYVWIEGKGKKFASGTNGKDCFFFYGSGNEFCVVTEAVIDGLSVYAACSKTMDLEIVSIMSGGRGYQEKLTSLGRPNPVLFFDNDDAGRAITALILQQLGGKCRLVDWSLAPEGMKDCNDLLKAGRADVIEKMVRLSRVPTVEEIEEGEDEVSKRIKELNEQYSVVMLGGKCVVMREIINPAFNRKDITFSSFNDFRNFHSNEKHWIQNGTGKAKKKPIADIWLEQLDRTQYQGIVFSPERNVEGYFNLWKGFSVQPAKGNWDRFKEHLFETISGGSDEIFFYWLAWMADCVQNPGGPRPGTSIVMRGHQGVGKGAVAQYFGGIFGNHFLHLTQSKKLLGNFNQHLKDALLVFADEAFWAGDRSAEGTLRAMITEPSIWIEPKGKDAFSVRNHIRVIVASNNEWIVPAGMQERRFFVVDVLDSHQQDHAYFEKIYSEIKDGGREALLHDLLEVDLSKVNLREFPKTEALLDQKISSMTTQEKFWFECLKRGSIKPDGTYWDELCVTRDIYNQYLGFCEQMGERFPKTNSQFAKKLKELCPGIMPSKPAKDGVRVHGYHVPSLIQCRESMERILRHSIKWDDQSG